MEERLVSFCSRWAIMAQWRSLHFTKATRAAGRPREKCINEWYWPLVYEVFTEYVWIPIVIV
jgi:hypothetical protein